MAGAITLLPVVLAKLGPRLDWPHRRERRQGQPRLDALDRRGRAPPLAGGRGGPGSPRRADVCRHLPAAGQTDDADTLAQLGDAKEALIALEDAGIGEGALLRNEILIDGNTSPAAGRATDPRAIQGTTSPSRPTLPTGAWTAPRSSRRSRFPTAAPPRARRPSRPCANTCTLPAPRARAGGQPASTDDFTRRAARASSRSTIALIAIVTFILLARAFRSRLAPAGQGGCADTSSSVLRLAAGGCTRRSGSRRMTGSQQISGIKATGSIPSWVPLIRIAFLFGLSDRDSPRCSPSRAGAGTRTTMHWLHRRGLVILAASGAPGGAGQRVDGPHPLPLVGRDGLRHLRGADKVERDGTGLSRLESLSPDVTVILVLIVPAAWSPWGRWNWRGYILGWLACCASSPLYRLVRRRGGVKRDLAGDYQPLNDTRQVPSRQGGIASGSETRRDSPRRRRRCEGRIGR